MLFNSIDFAVFLPIVFFLYWFVANKSIKLQNSLIISASYLFYGWWDWRFLLLIILSTLVDFSIGLALSNCDRKRIRKLLLFTSIITNIGLLGFFKYYNFFLDNFILAFAFFGKELHAEALTIILPVGISFYTFQTMSYSIDVYRKKLKPTKDLLAFTAFVCYFPQLVAGPIERASNLLPQFKMARRFDYHSSVIGLKQVLWGLFKKVVIADNCAEYVNLIFENNPSYNGSTLAIGAILFAFQIYGDFSGYSDIAIGTSNLFGIRLMQNFAFPYFSRDIAEFWRRWHISLSTWFRDYLYIPLGGSKGNHWTIIRNIFIIFIVSGFWHGANWTFILWGALNALFFLPLLISNRNRKHLDIVAKHRTFPTLKEILQIMLTFALTTLAWVFFRAESINEAFDYLSGIFSKTLVSYPDIDFSQTAILIFGFLCVEWYGRRDQFAIEKLGFKWPIYLRWIFYLIITMLLFIFLKDAKEFIYFQF